MLTPDEEASLLGRIAAAEFEPVVVRGHAARRTVRHYGYAYDIDSWGLSPTERPPYSVTFRTVRSGARAED